MTKLDFFSSTNSLRIHISYLSTQQNFCTSIISKKGLKSEFLEVFFSLPKTSQKLIPRNSLKTCFLQNDYIRDVKENRNWILKIINLQFLTINKTLRKTQFKRRKMFSWGLQKDNFAQEFSSSFNFSRKFSWDFFFFSLWFDENNFEFEESREIMFVFVVGCCSCFLDVALIINLN